ncbi:MAG: carbon storage regulator [Ruminococcus sp.]|jgi:carbon storage regulator|nr:carbon storage regulator [Ruminococcus sp.]
MLVITRKKDESILIGDGIKITVVETKDGRVRIGVDAPKTVRIIRAEAAEATEFNIAATASRLPDGLLDKLKGQQGMTDNI